MVESSVAQFNLSFRHCPIRAVDVSRKNPPKIWRLSNLFWWGVHSYLAITALYCPGHGLNWARVLHIKSFEGSVKSRNMSQLQEGFGLHYHSWTQSYKENSRVNLLNIEIKALSLVENG